MKTCIRQFWNEDYDMLTVVDMRRVFSERPVKGTSACVCVVEEAEKTMGVNEIEGFSKLHSIQFEEKRFFVSGGCMRWTVFELLSLNQENSGFIESEELFDCRNTRVCKRKDTIKEK